MHCLNKIILDFLFYINKKYDINKFIKENKEELRGIYANLLKTVANMQKYKDLKNYIKFDEENKMFVIVIELLI